MAPSVVKDAKDFSRGLFVSSWDISAVEIRTAKSPNIIAIVVSIVVYKSALQWACVVTVSILLFRFLWIHVKSEEFFSYKCKSFDVLKRKGERKMQLLALFTMHV